MCDNRHYISEVPLSLNSVRKRVEAFLSSNGLRLAALERYVVISRDEDGDEIIAGGGLDGNVIKCVAVSEAARSEGLMNILVSRLIAMRRDTIRLKHLPSRPTKISSRVLVLSFLLHPIMRYLWRMEGEDSLSTEGIWSLSPVPEETVRS